MRKMDDAREEIHMLIGEMDDIRENIVETETQLAQLHANIYKCREETRKIRLGLPTKDYIEKIRIKAGQSSNRDELSRVRDRLLARKNKIVASFGRVRDKLHREFSRDQPKHYTWLFILLIASILLIVGRYIKKDVCL